MTYFRRRVSPIKPGDPIDYKDVDLLKKYVTERGKILPRRIYRFDGKAAARPDPKYQKSKNCSFDALRKPRRLTGFGILGFRFWTGIRLAQKQRLSAIKSAARRQRNNREIGLRVAAAQVLIKSKKLKNKEKKEQIFSF